MKIIHILKINNVNLKFVVKIKDFGTFFNSDLSFLDLINQVLSQVRK